MVYRKLEREIARQTERRSDRDTDRGEIRRRRKTEAERASHLIIMVCLVGPYTNVA